MSETATDGRRIGFVGIGTIGFQLAAGLVDSGYAVTAYDVDDEALAAFEAVGGEVAPDARSVGTSCDRVHLVVANDEQAEAAVLGDDGVFAGFEAAASDSSLLVVHSTLVPTTALTFADRAPAGVDVIDAPVSGTHGDSARRGEVTLMLGGDPAVIDRHREVLEALSAHRFHLGPLGAGLATKLANNAIHHAAEVATLEALDVGREFGVDEDRLLDALRASSGNTYFAQNYEYFTDGVFEHYPEDPYAFVYNIRKNLRQGLALADHVDVDVPLMGHVSQECPRWFRRLADRADSG